MVSISPVIYVTFYMFGLHTDISSTNFSWSPIIHGFHTTTTYHLVPEKLNLRNRLSFHKKLENQNLYKCNM